MKRLANGRLESHLKQSGLSGRARVSEGLRAGKKLGLLRGFLEVSQLARGRRELQRIAILDFGHSGLSELLNGRRARH